MKKKELRKIKDKSTSSLREEYSEIEFHIILIEPQGSINVGAIARSMKNFGFKYLHLFNPKIPINSQDNIRGWERFDSDVRRFSMHARLDILENTKIIQFDETYTQEKLLGELKNFLKKQQFNFIIGTSAKPGMFNNVRRINYSIDEVDLEQLNSKEKTKIGIIFGREPSGLSNEEVEFCDFMVRIPASDEYPVLNLSHAVTIILFSLFKKLRTIKKGTTMPSTVDLRERLYTRVSNVLNILEFNKDVDSRIERVFRNILGRSFSSMKEINLLLTLFLQIENREKLSQKK